jgi:hypothetical protein
LADDIANLGSTAGRTYLAKQDLSSMIGASFD